MTNGCIGAIDGIVVAVKCCSMMDSDNNPSSYYSAYYCCHGSSPICDTIHCMVLQNEFGRPAHNVEQ